MRQLRRLLLGWGAGARARAEEREARDTWCWDWTRAAVSTKSCTRFRATCGTIFTMDEILISMSGAACRLCVRPPNSSLDIFWQTQLLLSGRQVLLYLDTFVLCHPLNVLLDLL